MKSCRTIRATTKGISSLIGFCAFQLARFRTSCSLTFLPSQFRSTDSSTMRMLCGSRETGPTPAASSAGKLWNCPVRPWPASKVLEGVKGVRHRTRYDGETGRFSILAKTADACNYPSGIVCRPGPARSAGTVGLSKGPNGDPGSTSTRMTSLCPRFLIDFQAGSWLPSR